MGNKKFISGKRVLLTGGSGFLGAAVKKRLNALQPKEILIPRSKKLDLRVRENCDLAVKDCDIVIHLAAHVGGIGYNKKNPGSLFYDNISMGINLLEASRKAKIEKFVAIGTICAYPKFTKVPFREEDLWMGYPEETNAPYGLAKKMLLVQAQAYRQQYDFNAIYLLPVNLYGPGDNFNPDSSHVIPALIKKMVDAKNNNKKEITVWGTGEASREFLYVDDAAQGVVLATEHYNKPNPINLGSGIEIKIKHLVRKIAELIEFEGNIIWDKEKPDGQPRRLLDVSKAKNEFSFEALTSFEEGLNKTIEWYKKNNQIWYHE